MNSAQIKYILATLATLVFLYLMLPPHVVMDELAHTNQITSLLNGDDKHLPYITTFIIIHKIYVGFGEIFGLTTPVDFRLLSFIIAGLLSLTLMLICKHEDNSFNWLIASQLFFLPIALPYYPLVYTDILALVLMYLAYHQFQLKHHWGTALFATAAVLIRQPSLVWLGFFSTIVFFDKIDFSGLKVSTKSIWHGLIKSLPYIISILGFLIYFYLNKGIALGDKGYHQVAINITNVYFMILVFMLVFFPLFISRFSAVIDLLKKHQWILLLVIAGLPIYMATFSVTHDYNDKFLNMFLRNWLINHINNHMINQVVAYLISAYALLAFSTIKLKAAGWRWLYVFLPLSVIAMPLIEQRYYIVGMVFWQLSRQLVTNKIEFFQLLWMVITSLVLFVGVSKLWFFI
jgi:alpha-1,2-glucosyltransferase